MDRTTLAVANVIMAFSMLLVIAKKALKKSEEKYKFMIENISDNIWVFNITKNKFTYASPNSLYLRGYTPKELENQRLEDFVMPEFLEDMKKKMKKSSKSLEENPHIPLMYTDEIMQPCKDGKVIWVEYSAKYVYNSNNEIELIGVSRKIEERKKIEKEIQYLSFHDQLTGVFNRNFFNNVILEEMEYADSYNELLSMAMIDLDFFKLVNDAWGHPVGDEILKTTVRIIKNIIRATDKMFRFGGEEFVILMPKTSEKDAAALSEEIRTAVGNNQFPFIDKQTISIGVAQRLRSESFNHWYKRVDTALYQAKRSGRNRIVKSDENEKIPLSVIRLKWRTEWESGNRVIDQQHQQMNELGNRLIEMVLEGRDYEETLDQLTQLFTYIEYHFNYEEELLKEIGYPGYESHREIHKKLISKAQHLKEEYENGEIKSSAFFSFIVDDVIFGHLQDEDSKFFMYMQKGEK